MTRKCICLFYSFVTVVVRDRIILQQQILISRETFHTGLFCLDITWNVGDFRKYGREREEEIQQKSSKASHSIRHMDRRSQTERETSFFQEVRPKCWFPICWATKSVRSSLYESVSQCRLEHTFLFGHLFGFLELFLCAISVLVTSSRLPDFCPVEVYHDHDLRCTSIFTMIGCQWVYRHPYLLCVFL